MRDIEEALATECCLVESLKCCAPRGQKGQGCVKTCRGYCLIKTNNVKMAYRNLEPPIQGSLSGQNLTLGCSGLPWPRRCRLCVGAAWPSRRRARHGLRAGAEGADLHLPLLLSIIHAQPLTGQASTQTGYGR